MHKKFFWVVVCICASTLAGTGSASARIIEKNRFKGTIAFAVCSQTEHIVCDGDFPGTIQTDIFMSGEELVTRSTTFPDEAQNNLFVTARTINSCTEEFSASFGSLAHSSEQSLQSADLHGVVPLRDSEDESPAGTMSVDVTMQGSGAIVHDHFKLRFDFEGPEGTTIAVSVNAKGKVRPATASGTLSLNGSPVACTFAEAMLMDTNSGDKLIEHP